MAVNLQKTKTPMPAQDAAERIKNFDEVSTGYTEAEMKNEAARCLNCPNKPCVSGCPVHILIPDFIALLREGKYEEAYLKDRESSTLPAVCGRVCPQELQCESQCVRGRAAGGEPVAIGRLERWMADWYLQNVVEREGYTVPHPEHNGKKVAVIGSGPSGLSAANDLAGMGYEVTIYEAEDVAGGVLVYGIPEFVLPKKVVRAEVKVLTELGVKIKTKTAVGKDVTLAALKKEFDAVYIACGTGKSKSMGIEGEDAGGVYLAGEYLYKINLSKLNKNDGMLKTAKRAVIVGGGNVAMDAARCARRMGAEVTVVYRRDREQMPSRREEIVNTEDEGIKFETLANPVKIIADNGKVTAVECVKMRLTEETDARGKKAKPVDGSNYTLPCDLVIMALGYDADGVIKNSEPSLSTDKHGFIVTDGNMMTSIEGVFAGGDIVTGPLTVIKAMGAGRAAAKKIDEYIKANK